MNVERFKSDLYPEQINVKVSEDLKRRADRLKKEKRINVTAEIRKLVEKLIPELEKIS